MNRLLAYAEKLMRNHRVKRTAGQALPPEELDIAADDTASEDIFTASLHNLLPEDIDLKKKASAKKKKNSGAVVRRLLLVMCCGVFIVCAVYLAWNLMDKKRGADFYNSVADKWGTVFNEEGDGDGVVARSSLKGASAILCLKDRINAGSNSGSVTYDVSLNEMRAKLTSLGENFPDLYGWISVAGTTINYPLVQGEDNDYYLSHAPDKTPLVNGSIFVDYRNNTSVMRNFNTVLYGHNLTGGGMFHDVAEKFYKNEDVFMNTYIYIYTMEGAYVFEPFAVYETREDYQYFRTEFATAEEFVEFANEMQSNSIYQKNMEFVTTDRIITLSTCTNRERWGRYSLQAKLVQVIH